ncbi:MAG: inositol monophosphatase family protein [Microthrixaceae bacterium]
MSVGEDPSALRDLAERVATEAATMVRHRRAEGFGIDTKSTETDMVTELDKAADRLIRERLLAARPDDGIVSEEDRAHTGTSGVTWVVDPIDGTTNFVYGLAPAVVSIAATDGDRRPIAAAVVEIFTGSLTGGSAGGGAHQDGRRLTIPPPPPLRRALVATGFGYDPPRRTRPATLLTSIIGSIRDVRRNGAAAYDLCSVAASRVDALYEHGLHEWDYAAGVLIAREAGARVGDLEGGEPAPLRCLVAAHPDLYGPLVDLLVAAGAADLDGTTTS